MTTVPPPNVALPQLLAAAAAPTTLVIAQPPPALAAVPAGTTIEAVVVLTAATPAPQAPVPAQKPAPPLPPGPQSGALPPPAAAPPPAPTVVLHTAVGDVAVKLPIPLPEKALIELEVVRASPQQVTVRLTTVEGTPAQQYIAQNRASAVPAAAPTAPTSAVQAPITAGPQLLAPGFGWAPGGQVPFVHLGLISAQVTLAPAPPQPTPATTATPQPTAAAPPAVTAPSPLAATGPAPVSPPSAPPAPLSALTLGTGSELGLKIVSVQLPGAAPVFAAPAPVLLPAPPLPPASTSSAAPAPNPVPGSVVPPTLPSPAPQPGLALPGPAGLATPPPLPPAQVQPAAPLATASGVVVSSVNAIPLVDVEDHQVQLNVRANLPAGTKVTFDVTAVVAPRAGGPMPLPLPAAAPPLSGPAGAFTGWPTLSEAVGVLQRTDPVAAQQLAQAIPDGGPRTVVAVMSFVQALRSGDSRQWPGDVTLRALERAGPRGAHLAATLSGEVAELSARTREGSGGDWRALPIPWNAGGEIDRVALITRREGDGENDEDKGKRGGGQRFLVDLDLSRLGRMQLDGMFKSEFRIFDMVLRTKDALPEEMRRDLGGIFGAANSAMGLKGTLTFQVTKRFADPLGIGAAADKSGLWA